MKKTLVALAAIAAATGASAQVTISGYFGASYDQFSIGNTNTTRLGNTSENRVSDQSSRLLFNVNEDLGGGLSAIGQYDLRFKVDAAARIQAEPSYNTTAVPSIAAGGASVAAVASSTVQQQPAVDPVTNGNIHVGLASKQWGAVRLGRQDVYYVEQPNLMPAGLFLASNQQPVFHSLATANASRTPNFMWWTSPNINGFTGQLGYSTNPLRTSGTNEVEADVGASAVAAQRKGSGTYYKLNYAQGAWDATVSGIDYKSDYMGTGAANGTNPAGAAGAGQSANADQKGTTLVVKYQVTPQLRVALGRSDEKQIAVAGATLSTAETSTALATYAAGSTIQATANAASAAYVMGNNQFTINWAKRSNASVNGVEQADTGISQTTFAYNYNFSKNTSVGVMYTEQKTDAKMVGGLFYQGNNAYGGQVAGLRGETYKITSFALRQNF